MRSAPTQKRGGDLMSGTIAGASDRVSANEFCHNGAMRFSFVRILTILFVLSATACEKADRQDSGIEAGIDTAAIDTPATTVVPGPAAAANPVEFVDNKECVTCHRGQESGWTGSHHDLAMQLADGETVLGDFNNSHFTHQGNTTRFFKRGSKFLVNTEGRDGKLQDFEIKYTFGVEPLQQYLVEFPDGRLQALTVAWDTRPEAAGGQRWFHLLPDEQTPPGDPLHWTGRMHNWNVRCAECHSTNLQKNFDPVTDSYNTTWSALNVSCQACHGPGEAHLKWANAGEDNRLVRNKGLMVDYHGNTAQGLVDSCARCHSRRHRVSPDDAHARPLLDDFVPSTLQAGLYHPDGQILDEVYVYGSFLQSKMYNRGVGCTDCHDAHSARLKETGNSLCLQCHSTLPPERFPGMQAKDYDSREHHFHAPDSDGAQCVNCHMPARTYMVVDPRHDHSFRIPRPDLSVKLDVPNACNQCHTDESASWAAEITAKWYGTALRQTPHYGEVFAAARAGDPAAYDGLVSLATESGRPPIITATALMLLQNYSPGESTVNALHANMRHADPLVRLAATDTFGQMPSVADLKSLLQQLNDPVRAVRMEAARILAPIPREHLDTQQRQALEQALDEYRDTQLALADTPEALLNLAVLDLALGDSAAAEAGYLRAIEIAPEFVPARINLANLYNQAGRNPEAEQQFRAAIKYEPGAGEIYYSLGLLLAEEQRLTEAENLLATAVRLMPRRARVQYNHALLLQNLERRNEAEAAFKGAQAIAPADTDIVYALVIFYSQARRWQDALESARQLQVLAPDNPGVARMLEEIQQQISAAAVDQ
jgi:predicted CXXCH cytochrome family protein